MDCTITAKGIGADDSPGTSGCAGVVVREGAAALAGGDAGARLVGVLRAPRSCTTLP
jgi:hypothetical protein